MLIKSGSLNGYRFIKRWEGLKLGAYSCSAGVLTIGYGHTGNVKAGQVISFEQADKLFESDIALFEMGLNKALTGTAPVTQNQYDALLSLSFNCGIGAISELINYLKNKEKLDKVINIEETKKFNQYRFHKKNNRKDVFFVMFLFCKWINASGKPLEGLYNRRVEEAMLFLNI